MDALYFIRIIIEGRDDFTSKLSSATTALRAELAKLKNELKGVQQSYSGAGGGATVFSRASRNATDDSRRAVNTYRNVKKEVGEVANAFRSSERDMNRFRNTGNAVERTLFRVGAGFRGAARAIYDTQRGVRDMDFATRRAEGSFFNFFYNAARGADNFIKSFTRMNTVAALLAPLIFLLVQAVLQLAAALVSVASAAAIAAAALGGALLAGIMQLIPVVGLLAAAFHRLSLIMQASKLQTQGQGDAHVRAAETARAHREATERLADAQWTLRSAYQNVKDQAVDLRLAEESLIMARRQASRDLVDYENARRNAVLAEKDATISLMEAKKQLADLERQRQNQAQLLRDRKAALEQAQRAVDIARTQGDPAQLSVALQQLGAAQSNYSAIAQAGAGQDAALQEARARLAVDQAQQRKREAAVTLKRAIEDANRAEALGVQRAPAVVTAQRAVARQTRQLAEAHRAVAKAMREVADASSDLRNRTYAGAGGRENRLENIMGRLTPTERDTLKIINEFKKLWNKATAPLTDAITKAVGDALVELEKLLRDKKFMAAFQGLANVIGDQIRRLARFFTSPEQRRFFEEFAKLSSSNLPKIVTIFENLVRLAERIALAFAPVFGRILERTGGFLGRQIERADQPANAPAGFQQNRAGAFAARSEGALNDTIKFFGAFFRLMGSIISVASGPGRGAMLSMADAFNRWARELRTTKREGAQEFFQNAIKGSALILRLFGQLIALFFRLAAGSGFENFLKVMSSVGIPALRDIGVVYARLFDAVAKAANNPFIGKLLELFLAVYGISKLTPLGALVNTAWHIAVIGYLNQIAINTGVGGIRGVLGKLLGVQTRALGIFARAGILAAGFSIGLAIGTAIQKVLPQSIKDGIGSLISKIPGLGVARADAPVGRERAGAWLVPEGASAQQLQERASAYQYLLRQFRRRRAAGDSVMEARRWMAEHYPNVPADVFAGMYQAGGGVTGGAHGAAVPIVAHVGEWVVNMQQQMKLAQMVGRPISWIKDALFGGYKPGTTTFGGKGKPMLSDWGDQQQDAAGNLIYGGTNFVETPLGQWVQLSRATLAKMQRQPGWLPRQLLNTVGFRGANREQLQQWASKFYQFTGGGAPRGSRPFSLGGVVMPAFAGGGVVTSSATTPVASSTRSTEQNFQIVTQRSDVDIDYVMRVAKIHAEAG